MTQAESAEHGRVAGECLCGAVHLEIDYPARWAWHDHSAASRRAHGAAYATYVGSWRKRFRVTKGARKIVRYEDKTTRTSCSFCGRCGTPCSTNGRTRRTWSTCRAPSFMAAPAASRSITSASRNCRTGPTPADGSFR